jgi:hypothetical protein
MPAEAASMESDRPEPHVNDSTSGTQPEGSTPEVAPPVPTDPAALVQRLIEAGEWPDPSLFEQIAAAGESAVGPLLDFMRTYPDPNDFDREIVLYNGTWILGAIRSPTAIPVLAEIVRRYPEDSGELAAEVLGDLGAVAFEPLLEVLRDPGMKGYPRAHVIEAAKRAADPTLKARLAEALRPLLAAAIEQVREEVKKQAAESEDDEDRVDRDEKDIAHSPAEMVSPAERERAYASSSPEMHPSEEVAFLISDLADLADPEARDLIKTAFREDLVDEWIVDEKSVEESYRKGGERIRPSRDWLELYRERYREHLEDLKRPRPARGPHDDLPRTAGYREMAYEPPPLQPPETIRNTGPKLGRNDPCWCGSGKKYKKCHWGKDGRE